MVFKRSRAPKLSLAYYHLRSPLSYILPLGHIEVSVFLRSFYRSRCAYLSPQGDDASTNDRIIILMTISVGPPHSHRPTGGGSYRCGCCVAGIALINGTLVATFSSTTTSTVFIIVPPLRLCNFNLLK